jgi:hypothetical protein
MLGTFAPTKTNPISSPAGERCNDAGTDAPQKSRRVADSSGKG